MMGRVMVAIIVVAALITGASIYYLQVYAYYDTLSSPGPDGVTLVATDATDPLSLPVRDFQGIDSDSSPIRYRACFVTDPAAPALVRAELYPNAEPRVAPGWFDCFDAAAIGAAIEDGTARAYLAVRDVHYGIDRVAAILPDGRGFEWHQINRCGEVVFDGQPAPDDCPPPPDGTARQ